MLYSLSELNKEQLTAVLETEGVIRCLAVAGSGKTRVLTHRVAYLINNKKIDPSQIMVTTFTKKSTIEMKNRLLSLIGKENLDKLLIGTFHSIGYKILKTEFTLQKNKMAKMELLNDYNKRAIINEIIKNMNISPTLPDYYMDIIVKLKNNLISPESHILLASLGNDEDKKNMLIDGQVYKEYERIKEEKGLIDFEDMIYKLYNMFVLNQDILRKYQNKIKYILIDETQDCNDSQYTICKMISEPENNIFLVGDDDQSVYKFRNAKPENFINLQNDFCNLKTINLSTNYRSKSHILEAANKLIKNNKNRIDKECISIKQSKDNEKISFRNFNNEDDEAVFVSKTIKTILDKNYSCNDIYIIYRTNAQARAIEDVLVSEAIPYKINGGISFYERSEIKDLIAYYKLILNFNDNESFLRIINKPSRCLSKVFISELEKTANKYNCSLFNAINKMNKINKNANEFFNLIKSLNKFSKSNDVITTV